MRIKDFADLVYMTNVEKGFDVPGKAQNIDQKLLLAVGELVEAQNCLREGKAPLQVWFRTEDGKPEGFRYEIVDNIIRGINILMQEGLTSDEVEMALLEKAAFNAGRPHKHGREF